MLLFVAFPLLYTVQIGFTNYSSTHLLSETRVREYLLDQVDAVEDQVLAYSLHADGQDFGANPTAETDIHTKVMRDFRLFAVLDDETELPVANATVRVCGRADPFHGGQQQGC